MSFFPVLVSDRLVIFRQLGIQCSCLGVVVSALKKDVWLIRLSLCHCCSWSGLYNPRTTSAWPIFSSANWSSFLDSNASIMGFHGRFIDCSTKLMASSSSECSEGSALGLILALFDLGHSLVTLVVYCLSRLVAILFSSNGFDHSIPPLGHCSATSSLVWISLACLALFFTI